MQRLGRRLHRWSTWALALLVFAACERVEVTTVEVALVRVTPEAASIDVDGTVRLTASVRSSSGAQLSGRAVVWSSLDPTIAEVDQTGLVRGLGAGSARIQATSEGVSGLSTVTVTTRQPVIALAPQSLSFASNQDAGSPPTQTVAITELEGGPLTGLSAEVAYPLGQPSGWVAANLDSSSAPTVLTVGAVTGALPAGTYSATVRVVSAGAANSPQSVQIEFVVGPALPTIALSRPNATFATLLGGANPPAVQIGITNAGAGSVAGLSQSITYAPGQPAGWLTASLAGTTAPTTLTLNAATGSLGIGSYTAMVRLNSTTAANAPIDIPVVLSVANAAPGAPANLQANAASASRIDLSWTTSTGGAVERYRIERRIGTGAFVPVDSVGGGTTSYQNIGLTPATQYGYRIQACNAVGCSGYSNVASATTPQVAPGAPSNLQATAASSTRIDLAWSAASGATNWYRIERSTGGAAFAVVDSVGGGTTVYQSTGLLPATAYNYRVRACNAVGCSDYSNEASATTAQVAPGAPSNLQANAASSTQIDLGWAAASGTVAWYRIERRTGAAAFAVIDSVSGGTLSYQNTGLTPATQYDYRVQACNAVGCSAYSNEASATTAQVAPGAPSNLQAAAVSSTRIDLSWSASTGTVTWYRIERRTGGGGAFAVIDSVSGGTLSYPNTGLTPATQYDYRVQACNAEGCSDYSNEASATTPVVAPGAPSNLQANAVSSAQIDLSWSASTGAVAWYRIERRTGGGGPFAVIDSVAGGTLSYQNTGLTPVTLYTYRVRACNAIGCSDASNPASATTLDVAPGAPSSLQANAVSSSRIDLSWTASTGTVTWYRIERRTGADAFAVIDSVGGTLSYSSTGLSPATHYDYRVQACNAVGCSNYSNEASATTADVAPGAPSSLQANAVSSSRIDLSWTASTGTVTWYRIERRTGADAFAVIDSVASGTLSYENTGLSPATQYDYRVQACNAIGCSDYSNEDSATTDAAEPDPSPTAAAAAMPGAHHVVRPVAWLPRTAGPVDG